MRKHLLALAFALALFAVPPAWATNPDPPTLSATCGTGVSTNTFYISPAAGTHTGHKVYRTVSAHADQPANGGSAVHEQSDALGNHTHTWYEKSPQARDVTYWATTLNGAFESLISNTKPCNKTIDWIAGAETEWPAYPYNSQSSNYYGEFSEADGPENGGFNQGIATVTDPSPVLKGIHSFRCAAQTDSSTVNSDRCEFQQANADSTSRVSPLKLYENGDDLWISVGFYLDEVACLGSGSYDCGAISQEKQLGSCANPIDTLAVHSSAGGQLYLSQHNDLDNDPSTCPSNQPPTVGIWEVPISTDTWIRVLRHYKFSADNTVGYVESYVDTDGGTLAWTAIGTSQLTTAGNGLTQTTATAPTDIGYVTGTPVKLFVSTLKDAPPGTTSNGVLSGKCDDGSQTGHTNTGNWPCAHQRVGIYRNGNITGTTIIYHDGVGAGSDPGDVVDVAF